MALERYANSATPAAPETAWSALSAGVNAAVTTFSLTTAWRSHSRALIDSEYVLVTAGWGTASITVQRGIEGSTAASHASGAELFGVLTAGGLANSAGPMTTEGDSITLDASGNVVRVPAGTYLTQTLGDARYQLLGDYLEGVAWGDITGTLSAQTDLQSELDGKLSATLPGADTQILFKDGGALSADAGLAWAGQDGLNIFFTGTTPDLVFGLDVEPVAADYADHFGFGIYASVSNQSGGLFDGGVLTGIYAEGTTRLGAGRSTTEATGGSFTGSNAGDGTLAKAYGIYADAVVREGGGITDAYSGYFNIERYGAGLITNAYALYSPDLAGIAANPYLLWGGGRAVRRIKYESDGNMTDRWYNVDFTKYTPGAADQESLEIGRWSGNVVSVGPSASGTGVLRSMRLTGASVAVDGALTASNLSGTNTGDQDLSGYALTSALAAYQPIDADLTAIAALSTNGFAKRTGSGAWVIDPATYLTGVTWGAITGTLSSQTDLNTALGLKAPLISPSFTTPALGVAMGTTLTLLPSGAAGLTVTGATETTSQPLVSLTQTWNASGTTFKGVFLNVTNTASAAGSLLADLQVGSSGMWQVKKDGAVMQASHLQMANVGIEIYQSMAFAQARDVTRRAMTLDASGLHLRSSAQVGWSPNPGDSSADTFTSDTILVRDGAANTLALKNAANAQEFRVYGTTTGSKYLSLKHDGTNPIIGSSSGGLKVNSTAITPATTGTRYLIIDTAGNITSSASAPSGT